jgi:hypothetical protein
MKLNIIEPQQESADQKHALKREVFEFFANNLFNSNPTPAIFLLPPYTHLNN